MTKKLTLLFCLTLLTPLAFATPKTIVLVRHGDKWLTPEVKWHDERAVDQTLNPKGMLRSVALGRYFLKTFGKPDYVFATSPCSTTSANPSIREVQTAGPLVSELANTEPNGFKLNYPFTSRDYPKLGQRLLKDSQFNQKLVLIVWNHKELPAFVNTLGVTATQPAWPEEDFDSVYVLNYDPSGKLTHWERLEQQYPVK